LTRHNLRRPKALGKKEEGESNFTMKKKMGHRLFIPLTHTTPVSITNHMLLPKIVHSKNLS